MPKRDLRKKSAVEKDEKTKILYEEFKSLGDGAIKEALNESDQDPVTARKLLQFLQKQYEMKVENIEGK